MMYIETILHTCANCRERHNMCGHDYESKDCEYFVLGKCFTCALRNSNSNLCIAEDESGHGCPNFKE